MNPRQKRLALTVLGAALVFCLSLFHIWPKQTEMSKHSTGTNHQTNEITEELETAHSAAADGGSTPNAAKVSRFFSKPSLERKSHQEQAKPAMAKASSSWYLDAPEHPEAITNAFKLGKRSVTIISKKQINQEAVQKYLESRAVVDGQIDKNTQELKQRAAKLRVGMSVDDVIEVMGADPSTSAPRPFDGSLLLTYSSHPELARPVIGNRFSVLYLSFDTANRVSEWHFSSR